MEKEQVPPDAHNLNRQLKSRHIIMMALGGAIGAGLFQGSDKSISQAGPGVVFAYLLGGIILFFVMRGLGELAANNPSAGTFRELIAPILGPFTGHMIGWMYCIPVCWRHHCVFCQGTHVRLSYDDSPVFRHVGMDLSSTRLHSQTHQV